MESVGAANGDRLGSSALGDGRLTLDGADGTYATLRRSTTGPAPGATVGVRAPAARFDIVPANGSMNRVDWEEKYQKGEVFWDRGEASPPLKQFLSRQALRGRVLVPGCGRGHEVALAMEHGLDAFGLDIAPTAVAEAGARYPHLAERFLAGSLFDPPEHMHGAYDAVLEHTCMSALPPALRPEYRRGIDRILRPGGLMIGVWFINPELDPGHEGPPFPFNVTDLTALFADGYEIVEDYVPDVAFDGREGRERVRVLRRLG